MAESFFSSLVRYRNSVSPDKVAFMDWDADARYSWADLYRRSRALASFFVEEGLSKGDRVGFVCQAVPALFDAFFACSMTGVVLATYNDRLIAQELLEQINCETPRVIFFSECYREKIATIKRGIGYPCRFVCVDQAYGAENDLTEVDIVRMAEARIFSSAEVKPEDPLMLIHTGGTTGKPKAAAHSHKALLLAAINEILAWNVREADVEYICMPFFHVGGWSCPCIGMLLMGALPIISRRFSADVMLEITNRMHPTMFQATEAMLRSIAEHPGFAQADFSSYRLIVTGGATITEAVLRPYWDRGIRVLNAYGMTEAVAHVLAPSTAMTLAENIAKKNTVGKPMLLSKVRIANERGIDAEAYEQGEILLGGDALFSGYWGNDAETEAIMDGEWMHTGDIGYFDEDGDCYIVGRSKDMYISGGENIFPLEVENVLNSHEDVMECAVVGVPDVRWGETGMAFVVAREGSVLTAKGLDDFLSQKLSTIKRPRHYQFVASIPKTGANKKDIAKIKAMADEAVSLFTQ